VRDAQAAADAPDAQGGKDAPTTSPNLLARAGLSATLALDYF